MVVLIANRTPSRRHSQKRAALTPCAETMAMLVRATWQIVVSRNQLARLTDLDDRMLSDIGLARSDLHAARLVPLWRDATIILKQRVKR
jgi:uncharacterized protein YjiS (DUF1127 family)